MDTTAFAVFVILLAIVTVVGFAAVRWRRVSSMDTLDQWGLGGRSFGGFVTWFLLGGDLYTAYTFIAVPGAMYALGAVSGWFAVAYTILVWPIVFVLMPRLWSVSHKHGFATPADFVIGRFAPGYVSAVSNSRAGPDASVAATAAASSGPVNGRK